LIGVEINGARSGSPSQKSCASSGVSIGSKFTRERIATLDIMMESSCFRTGIAIELRESYYVTVLIASETGAWSQRDPGRQVGVFVSGLPQAFPSIPILPLFAA
jgi:hypothetical protein